MSENSYAKRRLEKTIKAKYPKISATELNEVMGDIRKFVSVSQKIISEPQATFSYKTKTVKGKKHKIRNIQTDIVEVGKILRKDGKRKHGIKEAFEMIEKTFPKK